MLKSLRKSSVENRLVETQLYEFVMNELKEGIKHHGTWGQAIVNSEGNKEKAEAEYIKLRVQSVKDEITLNHLIDDEKLSKIQSLYFSSEKNDNSNVDADAGSSYVTLIFVLIILITFMVTLAHLFN